MITIIRLATLFAVTTASAASAAVRITEWQYNGTEFVELTNLGSTPVDMAGWSFDDDSRLAGTFSLTGLGTLAPGQSGIMAELTAAAFRAQFPSMSASVPVVGGNTANLGRNDEINIFDASNALVDRLKYNDQAATDATVRTDINSANPPTLSEALLSGTDNVIASNWVMSASGDSFGSIASTAGGFANPGSYVTPEPTSLTALAAIGTMLRRRP